MDGARLLLERQEVRFTLAGGVNVCFAYAAFVVLELALGSVLPYLAVLLLTYALGVSQAFLLHRGWVFRSRTPWLQAYLRFWSVYVVALSLNLLLLPALVEGLEIELLLAQLLALVLTSLLSYTGHRHFTFRSRTTAGQPGLDPRARRERT